MERLNKALNYSLPVVDCSYLQRCLNAGNRALHFAQIFSFLFNTMSFRSTSGDSDQ